MITTEQSIEIFQEEYYKWENALGNQFARKDILTGMLIMTLNEINANLDYIADRMSGGQGE